jgi:nitrate reductase delta subunit
MVDSLVTDRALFDALAALVDYPESDIRAAVQQSIAVAGRRSPAAGAALRRFGEEIAALPLSRLQETYIEAFDLDPACALDVGWHLHGERRERGELLASLRERLREAGVVESNQLPDHLTHVLKLLGREPDHRRAQLGGDCAQALEQVRSALHRRRSPLAWLVDAIHAAVGENVATGKR